MRADHIVVWSELPESVWGEGGVLKFEKKKNVKGSDLIFGEDMYGSLCNLVKNYGHFNEIEKIPLKSLNQINLNPSINLCL